MVVALEEDAEKSLLLSGIAILKEIFTYRFLTLLYLLTVPFLMRFVLYPVPYQERDRLADFVKEETSTEDVIYAWDDTATLYRKSERLSPSAILSPMHYTATEENRNKLHQ